ncbi:hypothetical protein CBL_04227 [Carabus blaptoides fortunei]
MGPRNVRAFPLNHVTVASSVRVLGLLNRGRDGRATASTTASTIQTLCTEGSFRTSVYFAFIRRVIQDRSGEPVIREENRCSVTSYTEQCTTTEPLVPIHKRKIALCLLVFLYDDTWAHIWIHYASVHSLSWVKRARDNEQRHTTPAGDLCRAIKLLHHPASRLPPNAFCSSLTLMLVAQLRDRDDSNGREEASLLAMRPCEDKATHCKLHEECHRATDVFCQRTSSDGLRLSQ